MKRAVLLAPLPLVAACCRDVGYAALDANFYVPLDALAPDMGAQCAQLCEQDYRLRIARITECEVQLVDAGVAEVSCAFLAPAPCIGGRRPGEWIRVGRDARHAVGRWLAEAAQLEAASVPAFEILARELAAHDAPPSLIARALASSDDERRHARIMTSLARAHGATPGPVRVVVREPRALEAIARENAVEGLVREAYGARRHRSRHRRRRAAPRRSRRRRARVDSPAPALRRAPARRRSARRSSRAARRRMRRRAAARRPRHARPPRRHARPRARARHLSATIATRRASNRQP